MSSSAGPDPAPFRGGLTRRTLVLVIAGEAVVAAVVAGVAIRGVLGWALVVLAVLFVPLLVQWRRGMLRVEAAPDDAAPGSDVRVVSTVSRSSGDVGVAGDEQGFAAGLELGVGHGAALDLGRLVDEIAGDPSHLSAVQLRITSYLPVRSGGRRRGTVVPVHRRADVLLRFEPARAGDVVANHGGGAAGSRAALVAAVDRMSMRLRHADQPNRVLDTASVSALLTEDTEPAVPSRLLVADLTSGVDVARLLDLAHATGAQRSVVSVCVDLADGDQWRSHGVVLLASADRTVLDNAVATMQADAAILGIAPAGDLVRALPLGGGPGDLAEVLTLRRR